MHIFWMGIVSSMILALVFTDIQAEECKTKIDNKDRYSSLNNILACLSKKIENLESEIKILKTSSGDRERKDVSDGQNKAKCIRQQEQDGVLFCLEELPLPRSADKKVISVVLSVTNTREKPVRITFVTPHASVLDDKTNVATVSYINGIIPCTSGGDPDFKLYLLNTERCLGNWKDTSYTTLNPNISNPFLMRFIDKDGTEINGSTAALAATFLIQLSPAEKKGGANQEAKYVTVPLSMSGLPLSQ